MKSTVDLEKLEHKARIAELASKLTWLRVHEAAAYLNMGQSKLWELVANGIMPSCKDEGGVVLKKKDLDKYWEQRKRSLEVETMQSEL